MRYNGVAGLRAPSGRPAAVLQSRRMRIALVAVLVAASGCQSLIGIDDVSTHLPYVDGEYLIGLDRGGSAASPHQIRLRGTASLDVETRRLELALSQLSATGGTVLAENAISNLVFPEGATAVEFDLSIEIRAAATEPPTPVAESQVSARMRMTLEGDFALCAESTTAGGPTIGSILVDSETPTPTLDKFSYTCDDL